MRHRKTSAPEGVIDMVKGSDGTYRTPDATSDWARMVEETRVMLQQHLLLRMLFPEGRR